MVGWAPRNHANSVSDQAKAVALSAPDALSPRQLTVSRLFLQ